jgi:hypothetical protein
MHGMNTRSFTRKDKNLACHLAVDYTITWGYQEQMHSTLNFLTIDAPYLTGN